MDELALLAHLHGFGPASLHRLKLCGIEDCRAVSRASLDVLSSVLDCERGAADRFRRDAAIRRERDSAVAGVVERQRTPLRPHVLVGMDEGVCVRLRELGVHSLEELAECESLELARAMEGDIGLLMRLKFLARRRLDRPRELTAPAALPEDPRPKSDSEPRSP